ncbi:MAG: 30S ribosomal protein S18 [Chloroflexi bacterium]|nr:30S ribosomal protein S18 [Chloroflexota bacterium]
MRTARPRRRYGRRRRVCAFCAEHVSYIDYKRPEVLSRYLSERGQIWPRRKTGLCSKHQRALAVAIKRARFLALLPFTWEHIRTVAKRQG